MTTKDEALKLALEALDEAIKMWREEMEYRSCIDAADSWEKTSTAIKQALAAPYVASQLVQEPVAWMEMVVANLVREGVNKHKARELAQHFYTTPPAAPVQEPVAQGCTHPNLGCGSLHSDGSPARWGCVMCGKEFVPKPAAQPALKPLTDEQIHDIYDQLAKEGPYGMAVTRRNVARAIEASHNIKGTA